MGVQAIVIVVNLVNLEEGFKGEFAIVGYADIIEHRSLFEVYTDNAVTLLDML